MMSLASRRFKQSVQTRSMIQFKVDRLQIIVVAKNITVFQLFISRMPKMCAIPQLVSAPLNPIAHVVIPLFFFVWGKLGRTRSASKEKSIV